MHGIRDNPWDLPSYRFGALFVAYLKDDKVPEGITEIDNSLLNSDNTPHPFHDPAFSTMLKAMGGILSVAAPAAIRASRGIETETKKPIPSNLPIEEQKRLEAQAAGKAYRVPAWWRGEQANYKIAKNMMGTLPKKIGPIKD